MKGLRFNLRTLLLASTFLAGAFYFGWRYSKYHPTGDIPEDCFACQIEDDGQGLLLTITASNQPIQSVDFHVYSCTDRTNITTHYEANLNFTPCDRKQIRITKNAGNEPDVENDPLRPLVRLPDFLGAGSYFLQLPENQMYLHLGFAPPPFHQGVITLKNSEGVDFSLDIMINLSRQRTRKSHFDY